MTTGFFYILLSSACSVLIAHLLKVAEHKKLNTLNVLIVNYLTAALYSWTISMEINPARVVQEIPLFLWLLAGITGFFFITNFFFYSKSVYLNGVGVSISAMRISLIIPVFVSAFWYMENIGLKEWIGIVLVFTALILLIPEKRSFFKKNFPASWLLILLFFFTGFGDASLKIFESELSGSFKKELFMSLVFVSALFAGFVKKQLGKKYPITRSELFMGIIIGIPNLYSSLFLIDALFLMNGAIVYPVVNIMTVLGGTVLGLAKWGDFLTPSQWTGIIITLVAILLLV